MKIAKIILAGTAALTIIGSAASAQQPLTGTITKLNRLNGTIAIQQTQSGTIGANSGGAGEEFKVQDGLPLDAVHAGDKVTFSTTEKDGIKTITKLQKQ
jgi:Cu/Ag efflux protein CusF